MKKVSIIAVEEQTEEGLFGGEIMRISISGCLLPCLLCAVLPMGTVACGSDSAGTGTNTTAAGGAGTSAGGAGIATGVCDTANRSSVDTPLTSCTQTAEAYPGESVPACGTTATRSSCPAQQMGIPAPAQRCGTMIACPLDRFEAITSKVQTTYTPGPANYTPPEPPHDDGADPISPIGTWMHAEATAWFARPESNEAQTIRGTDQPGSCGIWSRDLMIVAIPTPQFGQNDAFPANVWNLAYWCGACAEVVGPSGKRARVQVVTQRAMDPGSDNYYSIDLPGNLYTDSRIDTPYSMIDTGQLCSIGMPVDWRIVPCEVCGGIVLSYTPGFNTWTPAFRILNHRLPIVDAYYMTGGNWQRLQRDSVNQFHTGPADPMQIRIVAIDGSTIEGSFPAYASGKSFEATSQF